MVVPVNREIMYQESRVSLGMAQERRTLVWQIRLLQAETPLVNDVIEKTLVSASLEELKREKGDQQALQ